MLHPTKPKLSLRQVFLPYYDLVNDDAGWQFGLPVLKGQKGLHAPLAKRSGMSVLRISENGQVYVEPHPILTCPHLQGKSNEPPKPQWAWVPVELDEETHYARVVAPQRARGSMPLSLLQARQGANQEEPQAAFYTPHGLERYEIVASVFDLPNGIPSVIEGCFSLELGDYTLAEVEADERGVLTIIPSAFSIEHKLWTCHLARVCKVLLS